MSTLSKKPLVLIDSHALLHRAYHAIPKLTTREGKPSGALYGFLTMLRALLKKVDPAFVIATFDEKGGTFRHASFSDYKGTRNKTEDDLIFQLKEARIICQKLGITTLFKEGFEADDILGTLCKTYCDIPIVIITGDHDTLQLVENNRVQVLTLKKGIKETILYDEQAVIDYYGFLPNRVCDYKGLAGDQSDNIPGVKGIGEKTAKILCAFGNLEEILVAAKENPEELKALGITDRIIRLLVEQSEEAEFSKILATIRLDVPLCDFSLPLENSSWELNQNAWDEICDTYNFSSLKKESSEKDTQPKTKEQKEKEREKETTKAITPSQKYWYTLQWIFDTNKKETSVMRHFPENETDYKQDITTSEEKLAKEDLLFIWEQIEKPLLSVVEKMNTHGIKINLKTKELLYSKYQLLCDTYEKQIQEIAGYTLNVRSPKQISELLFETLQLSSKKKTASGGLSTNEEVLELLKNEHAIIPLILQYRESHKILSTYIEPLNELLQENSCVYPQFIPYGASTGRFSCHSPNIQQLPGIGSFGEDIRSMFIAREGFTFLSLDYSQIELRIAAILSGDETLCSIFKEHRDIHSEVAHLVFSIPKDAPLEKELRRKAKVINFGILYGMGANSLAKELTVSPKEAKKYLEDYFLQFPKLLSFLESTKNFAREHRFTKTLFGRKRFFPEFESSLSFIRASGDRMAINAPIQGTAADCIKLAMIESDNFLKQEFPKSRLLLQIHDELVFEVLEKDISVVTKKLTHILETILQTHQKSDMLLEVHTSIGDNLLFKD
jgi:DNA polymerase I